MNNSFHRGVSLPVMLIHASDIQSAQPGGGSVEGSGEVRPSGAKPEVDCFSTRLMCPLFHYTAHDAVIIAMEHNSHSKMLAVSTSKHELFVTLTQNIPVESSSSPDEGQLPWECASSTLLIDRLPYPCTHLAWAPWQHGIHLACVCPGKQVRLYRCSHSRWSFVEIVGLQDCNAVAFSAHFTIACACARGTVLVFARATANEDNAWTPTSKFSLEKVDEVMKPSGGRIRPIKDFTCLGWDEAGNLLALADEEGVLRIFVVSNEGKRLMEDVVYKSDPLFERGKNIRQVSWAPGAGRSFLILAVAASYKVILFFFKRARSTSLVHGATPQQLELIDMTTSSMEEISKLSWNTTGTRFVTAHTDGAVRVWAVDAFYQQSDNNMCPTGLDSIDVAATQPQERNLSLKTAIRRVSVIYPYHGEGH